MAVLLDASGSVLEGQLGGNTVTTGVTLSEESGGSGVGSSSRSGSSSSSYLYFAFPDLFVLYSGNYSIRVDIHLVDYQDAAQGARLLAQAETRSFTVYDEYVAVEKPGELLDCAKHLNYADRLQSPMRDASCNASAIRDAPFLRHPLNENSPISPTSSFFPILCTNIY